MATISNILFIFEFVDVAVGLRGNTSRYEPSARLRQKGFGSPSFIPSLCR